MMLSVEDFLAFQRRRLDADKQELVNHVRRFLECYDAGNGAAATSQDHTKKIQEKNSGEKNSDSSSAACTPRHGSSMIKANQNFPGLLFKDDEPIGLPLGQHEERRKKLAEERKADYNRFLIEKEKQLQQKKESAIQRRNTSSETSTPRSIASMNYQEVLQRKKEEEKQYRNLNHLDPVDDSELLRLQGEADKLKSERDNITMLINNLKRFADSEPSASTSQTQFSHSVPVVGASASPVKAPLSFPAPPSFPSVLPPSTAPTAYPSMQGNGSSFQDMQNTLNFTQSLPLPTATQRMPNLEYSTTVQPLAFPSSSSSFQNPLFTGLMAAQQPKPNQFLNNADYMRELDEQVRQKQLQKMREMEDEKQQQQNGDFFPWGNTHGGGGAPMRDRFGNIITSRKGKALPVLPSEMAHPLGVPIEKDVPPVPSTIVNTVSTYNREYEAQRKHERYKEDLRKQIEEKKRLLQEEKERQRLEEDRLAQRIEDQRLRMQREYEEEQTKRIRKEEELRLKQERLMQLQEEQRKEEERRKREAAEKRERERLEKLRELEEMRKNSMENQQRSKSPPVPTVRTQTLDREKTPKSEVPSDPRQNVLSQLTQLRQQLQDEQQKMNAKLKEQKKKYKVMDRRAVQEDSDDDDENEVQRLRRNSAKSRESSADSRGYTQRSRRWNKENIKYTGYDDDSDVRVENLD